MRVPLLDLRAQYETIRAQVDAAVAEVLNSQEFILGSKVKEFEGAIASYSQSAHGIGVSSGTDALLIALMAEGIGPGDEVITPAYSFFATAGCVSRLGARPVFVDIDPTTYNVDPQAVAAAITSRTRAIIPVHLYGQVADMDALATIASRHKLIIIEDAAQAIGAELKGHRAGSIGDYGCLSFFPSKNLGGGGDGGMVLTQDAGRADRLTILRGHGARPKYYHKLIGGNFRLDALQAAILNAKLPFLERWTQRRQENANLYYQLLAKVPELGLPNLAPDRRHVFNQFVVHTKRRDALKAHLESRGVATEIYYPVPFHMQECFADLGVKKGQLPNSERAAESTLALPIYPELTEAMISHVAKSIAEFFA